MRPSFWKERPNTIGSDEVPPPPPPFLWKIVKYKLAVQDCFAKTVILEGKENEIEVLTCELVVLWLWCLESV